MTHIDTHLASVQAMQSARLVDSQAHQDLFGLTL